MATAKDKQECIPVGCILPACYRMGGLPGQRPPPGQRIPQTETPLP